MVVPTATCLIREQPYYRRDLFNEVLERLGYRVERLPPRRIRSHDILITWNRYGLNHDMAVQFERAGAAVIVVENGFLPMRDTKKSFALALYHHNGAGVWSGGEHKRGHLLDVELRPWFTGDSGDILLLPQRGIGPPGVAMPRGWLADVQRRLHAARHRRIRVRLHPGTDKHDRIPPVEHDLNGVRCVVTWGSGAALKAIIAGIPVFYELDRWIGGPCAQFGIEQLEAPVHGDREALLERVAWAQWTLEEMATAEPIDRLIELHKERTTPGEQIETRAARL